MNSNSTAQMALATALTAAQDQYCPLWEVLDEIAQACDVTRERALTLFAELRPTLEATAGIRYFLSMEPYGTPVEVSADKLFSDGVDHHNEIGDGPPFYYIHQVLRGN